MIHAVRPLLGLPVRAVDGETGKLFDLYFNDKSWDIKYFVVEIDGWTFDKRVLIEPKLLFIGARNYIHTPLTNSEIWHSHDYDTQRPVSRQDEENGQYSVDDDEDVAHLRSAAAEVMAYRVITTSGKTGLMQDLLFNEQSEKIDKLVTTIDNIQSLRVERISFEKSMVFVL